MLFAIKEEKRAKIEKLAIELNIKITEIGFFSNDKNKEIKLFNRDNKKIKIKKYGYEHYNDIACCDNIIIEFLWF